MDVEKTIEFLLQNQASLEAGHARLQEGQVQLQATVGSLAGVVRDLAFAQAKTEERVHELMLLQKAQAETVGILVSSHERLTGSQERLTASQEQLTASQQGLTASHQSTRDTLDALIKLVDEWIRHNGKH